MNHHIELNIYTVKPNDGSDIFNIYTTISFEGFKIIVDSMTVKRTPEAIVLAIQNATNGGVALTQAEFNAIPTKTLINHNDNPTLN